MALVAWAPTGYAAPMELLAVKLPPGPVTERQWWEALADRVSDLAVEAGPEATQQAWRDLGLPETDEPMEAGQYLVLGNLNLLTHPNCAVIDNHPFPATVTSDPDAKQAMEETDLEAWVGNALSLVSGSSLD